MVVGMDGAVRAQPFLDIHSLISTGSERGLLSVAFHPDYTSNGYFFVDYTNVDGTVIVARYHVSQNDPDRADPASAHIILPVPHPVENHNGGLLLFGPDGYLYLGIGDCGTGDSGMASVRASCWKDSPHRREPHHGEAAICHPT